MILCWAAVTVLLRLRDLEQAKKIRRTVSMKYQISCNMTFDAKNDRNMVHSFLASKYYLAYLPIEDAGDFINPDSISSAVEQQDGPFNISCKFRLVDILDRDKILNYLNNMKKMVNLKISGFIEFHDCYHDEQTPCLNSIKDTWGLP